MMLAYVDCTFGISGDMLLGALIDLGAPLEAVERSVRAMRLRNVRLSARRDKRGAISGRRFNVRIAGKGRERDFKAISGMIKNAGGLEPRVRKRALSIFRELARVEGKIHGVPVGKVHFHEVGAVDSIVDIVGSCAAMESLGIGELACSPVPLGGGTIDSRHGVLPVPAPATVELLEGLVSYGSGYEGEMTTPTGAAILKALAGECGPMPPMVVEKAGYGVGAADFPDRPNILRVVLGRRAAETVRDRSAIVEANVDDMSPQDFDDLMESLFEAGAHDVSLIGIHMKKNRPGVMVQALAPEAKAEQVVNSLFQRSSTLGARIHRVDRRILKRTELTATTEYGVIRYKRSRLPGGGERLTPEYEDLKAAAKKANVSVETARRAFWAAVSP